MALYTLPTQPPFNPPVSDSLEVSGEDVMFTDQLSISAGDWQTVTGAIAAQQSVVREATANIGAMLRRPDWGMGISQTVFQGVTNTLTSNMITRIRNRMQLNPRVGRFIEATVFKQSAVAGTAVSITYEVVGVAGPKTTVLKGSR